jgi:hypothetical protein
MELLDPAQPSNLRATLCGYPLLLIQHMHYALSHGFVNAATLLLVPILTGHLKRFRLQSKYETGQNTSQLARLLSHAGLWHRRLTLIVSDGWFVVRRCALPQSFPTLCNGVLGSA